MSKFLKYFFLVFGLSLAIFNFRLLLAEGKYQFSRVVQGSEKGSTLDLQKGRTLSMLPLSDSRFFFLEIPSLGVKVPIVLEKNTDSKVIFNQLVDGVVHYGDTPLPGQKGTSIILGHSSAYPWYKGRYGSVFALLGKLKKGDTFFITNGDKVFTYQVSGSLVFNPFDSNNEQIRKIEQTENSSILLVSCWPVGTNYKRIAVRGDLISD